MIRKDKDSISKGKQTRERSGLKIYKDEKCEETCYGSKGESENARVLGHIKGTHSYNEYITVQRAAEVKFERDVVV